MLLLQMPCRGTNIGNEGETQESYFNDRTLRMGRQREEVNKHGDMMEGHGISINQYINIKTYNVHNVK